LSVYPTNLLFTRVANSQKDQPTPHQGRSLRWPSRIMINHNRANQPAWNNIK